MGLLNSTHLVSEVRRLCHMTKEPDLHNARQHFYSGHDLTKATSSINKNLKVEDRARTVKGSFITSVANGASMIKLALSETTGPAFIFAMRKTALGDPNVPRRF